jgi:hypothetical protein
MAKQTFTAGQVLTAAQVNGLQTDIFNQTTSTKTANYTLLVGDRGTRVIGNGTSITFTVDNSIFAAGDTIKLHNINSTVLTIAAGVGVTINAAAGLTIAQYQEATLFATSASSFILFESTASSAQGLTLLNTTSFSAVASQSVNNVFSATYDNYLLVISGITGNGSMTVDLKLRASGTDSSTNYYWGLALTNHNGTSIPQAGSNVSTYRLMNVTANKRGFINLNIEDPFLASDTLFQGSLTGEFSAVIAGGAGGGLHTAATSYDGFTILSGGGTISGSVNVYGYNK